MVNWTVERDTRNMKFGDGGGEVVDRLIEIRAYYTEEFERRGKVIEWLIKRATHYFQGRESRREVVHISVELATKMEVAEGWREKRNFLVERKMEGEMGEGLK